MPNLMWPISPPPPVQLELTDEEARVLSILTSESHTVGVEEAEKRMSDVLGFIADDMGVTRSAVDRRIKDLTVMKFAPGTREVGNEALPDTMAYIINFADNMGYAVISGDNRVPEQILTYSGEGNIGDEIENPGFRLFLTGAEHYIARSIREYEQRKDSIAAVIATKIEASMTEEERAAMAEGGTRALLPGFGNTTTIIDLTGWEVSSKIGPLLPVEWGQDYPYNYYVRYNNSPDGVTPTGCVATAAAQIMAYWKYPTKIDIYSIDWNQLNQYSDRAYSPYKYRNWSGTMYGGNPNDAPLAVKQNIGIVMDFIGRKLGMKYSPDGSGAQTHDVPGMLISWGYKVVGIFSGYKVNGLDEAILKNAIDAGRPVLMEGRDAADRHAWVADGYIERRKKVRQTTTTWPAFGPPKTTVSTYYVYSYHIHHNWGWNGYYNGFFVSGCFDAPTKDKIESNATRAMRDDNYRFGIIMFPYITK